MPIGKGKSKTRFKGLVRKLRQRGARNPEALAAWIERKKTKRRRRKRKLRPKRKK